MQYVGRKYEKKELECLNSSTQAEFVALYGRRRVGKTYLIRSFFNDNFTFQIGQSSKNHTYNSHIANNIVLKDLLGY